jgi:hypothetical protein
LFENVFFNYLQIDVGLSTVQCRDLISSDLFYDAVGISDNIALNIRMIKNLEGSTRSIIEWLSHFDVGTEENLRQGSRFPG